MTYSELCQKLRCAGVENAEWDAALLIEHFCGVSAAEARLFGDCSYDHAALLEAAERRCARFPLQYLIGRWKFYRQTYEVSPDCLIPRADTEILVEEAIRLLPRGAQFADLCTGSGCIAISVLVERPDTVAVALEKYPSTLALAERNAVLNDVRERFTPLCADVLKSDCLPKEMQFDAILSNPPYIPAGELEGLAPELGAEPRVALDGGADGLVFYRSIVTEQAKHLKENGCFLLEIGYDQADAIRNIAAAAGFPNCRILKDYGGNDRVAVLTRL